MLILQIKKIFHIFMQSSNKYDICTDSAKPGHRSVQIIKLQEVIQNIPALFLQSCLKVFTCQNELCH